MNMNVKARAHRTRSVAAGKYRAIVVTVSDLVGDTQHAIHRKESQSILMSGL